MSRKRSRTQAEIMNDNKVVIQRAEGRAMLPKRVRRVKRRKQSELSKMITSAKRDYCTIIQSCTLDRGAYAENDVAGAISLAPGVPVNSYVIGPSQSTLSTGNLRSNSALNYAPSKPGVGAINLWNLNPAPGWDPVHMLYTPCNVGGLADEQVVATLGAGLNASDGSDIYWTEKQLRIADEKGRFRTQVSAPVATESTTVGKACVDMSNITLAKFKIKLLLYAKANTPIKYRVIVFRAKRDDAALLRPAVDIGDNVIVNQPPTLATYATPSHVARYDGPTPADAVSPVMEEVNRRELALHNLTRTWLRRNCANPVGVHLNDTNAAFRDKMRQARNMFDVVVDEEYHMGKQSEDGVIQKKPVDIVLDLNRHQNYCQEFSTGALIQNQGDLGTDIMGRQTQVAPVISSVARGTYQYYLCVMSDDKQTSVGVGANHGSMDMSITRIYHAKEVDSTAYEEAQYSAVTAWAPLNGGLARTSSEMNGPYAVFSDFGWTNNPAAVSSTWNYHTYGTGYASTAPNVD